MHALHEKALEHMALSGYVYFRLQPCSASVRQCQVGLQAVLASWHRANKAPCNKHVCNLSQPAVQAISKKQKCFGTAA